MYLCTVRLSASYHSTLSSTSFIGACMGLVEEYFLSIVIPEYPGAIVLDACAIFEMPPARFMVQPANQR